MNFLNKKMEWTNTEFIAFKLCVASIYVLVGAYFHEFFWNNRLIFFALFLIAMVITVGLWWKKMKN